MSTLFGHAWEGDTCTLHTLPADPPFYGLAQNLSPDILLQIFSWAQMEDIDDVDFSQRERWRPPTGLTILSRAFVPWNVSQVCRTWRVVALESAKLWSAIVVHDATSAFWKPPMMRDSLKRFLARSRKAPLTISARINSMPDSEDHDGFSFSIFIQRLTKERSRWRRVSIFSYSTALPPLPSPPSESFRLDNLVALEELTLRLPTGDSEDPAIHLDLSGCRRLQSLLLEGSFHLTSDNTLMAQLKHVELRRHPHTHFFRLREKQFPTPSDCDFLLRLTPSLESLIVEISGSALNEIDNAIHLPTLEDLRISIETPYREALRSTCCLMDRLFVPSLKVLHVEGTTGSCINGLVQRSKCALTSLVVDAEGDQEEDSFISADWLSDMPRLKDLKLTNAVIDGRVLAALVLIGRKGNRKLGDTDCPEFKGLRAGGLCPKLEKLEFETSYFQGDRVRTAKLLNAILRSRVTNVEGSRGVLKSLMVDGCLFLSPDEEDSDSDSEVPPVDELFRMVGDGVVLKSSEMRGHSRVTISFSFENE